jgi:glycosyltransferase 2 family protein
VQQQIRKRTLLRWLLGLALGALGVYGAWQGVDLAALQTVMTTADVRFIALAVPFFVCSYTLRALRWRQLFPAAVRASGLRHALGILLVGFLANNVMPARGGEVLRVMLMKRYNAVPASGTLATLLAERVFDGLVLGLTGLLSLRAIHGEEASWLGLLLLAFGSLFVALLLAAQLEGHVRAAGARLAQRCQGRLSEVLERSLDSGLRYVAVLASGRTLLRVGALTCGVWFFEALVFAFVARAFGLSLGAGHLGGLLSVVNFASLAPTPGGLGAIELAGTAVLAATGVERGTAFLVVSAQHALQYAFCLVLGGWYATQLGIRWSNTEQPEHSPLPAREALTQ